MLDHTVFALTRLREIELGQFGLTIPQTDILHGIEGQGGSWTLQDLEKNRMRQHHSISTLVNRMAKIGLVEKTRQLNGKRYQITITAGGKEIYNRATGASLKLSFSVFSIEDKYQLASYLAPILERARYLLGMSQTTPILRHLYKTEKEAAGDKRPSETRFRP